MLEKTVIRMFYVSLLILVFSLGWIAHDMPVLEPINNTIELAGNFVFSPREKASPKDRISEDQIQVFEDYILIDIKNAQWAKFADTNSMDPLFDVGHNAIEIVPASPDEIQVGDIISYDSNFVNGTVIHRVVEIGNDGEWFVKVKGDNNTARDPGRIRFDQIKRVLVAIIY